jgi:hypothetical protein
VLDLDFSHELLCRGMGLIFLQSHCLLQSLVKFFPCISVTLSVAILGKAFLSFKFSLASPLYLSWSLCIFFYQITWLNAYWWSEVSIKLPLQAFIQAELLIKLEEYQKISLQCCMYGCIWMYFLSAYYIAVHEIPTPFHFDFHFWIFAVWYPCLVFFP